MKLGHLPKDHNRPSDMIFAYASQFHVYLYRVQIKYSINSIGQGEGPNSNRGLLWTFYFVKVRWQL